MPFRLGNASGLVSTLEAVREKNTPRLNVPFCVPHGDMHGEVSIEGTEKYLLAKIRVFLREDDSKHDLMAKPKT